MTLLVNLTNTTSGKNNTGQGEMGGEDDIEIPFWAGLILFAVIFSVAYKFQSATKVVTQTIKLKFED